MCKKLILLTLCAFVMSMMGTAPARAGDPDLMAWWLLNDGQGTVALDSSDYGNHGTLMGGATWVDDAERGTVISFDGSTGYVDTDLIMPAMTLQNDFTWAFWAKQHADQATDNDVILGNRYGGDQSTTNGQFVKFTPTRFECYNYEVDATNYVNGITYNSIPGDVWIHHALVKRGAFQTYYRDGVATLTNTQTRAVDPRVFYMGADGFSGVQEAWQGYLSDVRLYTRALTAGEVLDVMAGKGPMAEFAGDPAPENETEDVPRDAVLSWTAGQYAATHDVYLGTVLDDVSNATRANPLGVLVSEGQAETTYDPDGLLEIGQTYYWRIDEVNAAPDNTIFQGEVWAFTAEPLAYPIAGIVASSNATSDAGVGPERTVDGSGLNELDQHSTESSDMWLGTPGADPVQLEYAFDRVYKLHEMLVWNYNVMFELILGFGLKDVTVEYSVDGAEWTVLGDVVFAQATAKADYTANTVVDFGGVAVQYVRLTVNSGYGVMGQFGLSEVRLTFIPAHAREPQPANGATGADPNPVLNWRVGRDAVAHDIYLSTDEAAVADGTALVDTVTEKGYAPGALDFGSTYYWRIDEVQEAESWAGDVWSFAVQEYAVIDDMESYNDDDNRIFDTWLDGFVNGTGSTVGYFEAPFAERTIVNSGRQSMPLGYGNSAAPFYSEAELDLGSLNLDTNGADSLRLFVAGQAPAFVEMAEGTILMNAIGTDIWDASDEFRYAYKQLTGDGSMVARVDYVDGAPSTWAKAGVMVRQSTEGGSRHSMMIMTGGDGNGASWQGRLTDNASSENTDATDPVAPPYWVRIDRAGDSLTGFLSADGETWTQLGAARTIAMNDPVLIGLALTSHNASQATSAEFSNITTTGNITGDWTIAEVGVAQPEGNVPEALYVALEDTSGNVAVVTHPDATITGTSGWTEWVIPYSDLAGVNLSRVAIMYIGVGDRDNPSAGGTGLIFVDDVGYGHVAE